MPVTYNKVSNLICQEVAITTEKFWCMTDKYSIREYLFNTSASPFTFTPYFNQIITFTHSDFIGFTLSVRDNDALISVNENVSPPEISYIDITSNPATLYNIGTLPTGRTSNGGILYVRDTDRVILCTENASNRYFVSQYDISSGYIEVDYEITDCMSASSFSTIFEIASDSDNLYILTNNGDYFTIKYSNGVIAGPVSSILTGSTGSGQFESVIEPTSCVPYEFMPGTASNKIYAFWLGDTTPETNLILYSDDAFTIGITLYTQSTLSTPYVGHSSIIYGLDVYTLTSGVVGTSTPYGGPYPTPLCSLTNYDIINTLSTNVLVTIDDSFGDSQTISCPGDTTLNVCSCNLPITSAPVLIVTSGGSCPW